RSGGIVYQVVNASRGPPHKIQPIGSAIPKNQSGRSTIITDGEQADVSGLRHGRDNGHRLGLIGGEGKVYSHGAETGVWKTAAVTQQERGGGAVPLGGVLGGTARETIRVPIAGGREIGSIGRADPSICRLSQQSRRSEGAAQQDEAWENSESRLHRLR